MWNCKVGHAVSLHFMYYNVAHMYQTFRVTLAMEAGISGHVVGGGNRWVVGCEEIILTSAEDVL
jgi:hypothetical protein